MKIFIGLCSVNDHMLANNLTPINIKITREMMTNAKFSRQPHVGCIEREKKGTTS